MKRFIRKVIRKTICRWVGHSPKDLKTDSQLMPYIDVCRLCRLTRTPSRMWEDEEERLMEKYNKTL